VNYLSALLGQASTSAVGLLLADPTRTQLAKNKNRCAEGCDHAVLREGIGTQPPGIRGDAGPVPPPKFLTPPASLLRASEQPQPSILRVLAEHKHDRTTVTTDHD
jgi:hypothetical protein